MGGGGVTLGFLKRMKDSYIQENVSPVMAESFPNVGKATQEILTDFIRYLEEHDKQHKS